MTRRPSALRRSNAIADKKSSWPREEDGTAGLREEVRKTGDVKEAVARWYTTADTGGREETAVRRASKRWYDVERFAKGCGSGPWRSRRPPLPLHLAADAFVPR